MRKVMWKGTGLLEFTQIKTWVITQPQKAATSDKNLTEASHEKIRVRSDTREEKWKDGQEELHTAETETM